MEDIVPIEFVTPEFRPYGKTPRWEGHQQVVISEKIDGTNALIHITEDGQLFAGSRNRWLETTPKTKDNFGFAAWCSDNQEGLLKLGPGWHYGEWWGRGIGRGYGREQGYSEYGNQGRTFSLFNTRRWGAHNPNTPVCCAVVPVLYNGPFTGVEIDRAVWNLQYDGSQAAPGFMNVEGVVAYFPQTDQRFKVVVDKRGPSPIECT